MPDEMIERCKAELERCFAPAIDFKAPYAKVMSDMAINAIIKAMREPTEKMLSIDAPDMPAGGDIKDIWHDMIDAVINDAQSAT